MALTSKYIFSFIIVSILFTSCLRISVGYHSQSYSDPDSVIYEIGGSVNEGRIGLSITHCKSYGIDSCNDANLLLGSDKWSVYFPHTYDSLKLDTIIEGIHFFTCENFEEKYRNNRTITVLLCYEIDSNDVRLFRANSYTLQRSESVVFSVH